jgi:ATP adenylyltransferase
VTPGTLWNTVVQRTQHAVERGALEPIDTDVERVDDGGVPFVVRVVSSLKRKERAPRDAARNPFVDYDEDLFVTDVPPAHRLLFNKFNVFDRHLLLVTRRFELQQNLLTEQDFQAWWACMHEFDVLGFYNAGTDAGASQPHKHMQLVPVPLGEGPGRTPMDAAVRAGTVPFEHALADPDPDPRAAHRRYLQLLDAIGCGEPPAAYNLLVTREWMMAVPRARERFGSISVNALGFAGSLLAKDREQLEAIRQAGPMRILGEVTGRPDQTTRPA